MLNDEQKGIFINDFNDPKAATYGLKGYLLESVGTKPSYVIPMFTLDEKFVGSLGIDYVGRKRRLTKNEWEHLQIKPGRIVRIYFFLFRKLIHFFLGFLNFFSYIYR